jgi:glycosyltransferase involved in cell wall biosynthesis
MTSNLSSLPEVVGDAATTVNPYSINATSDAMYEVLTNSGLAHDLARKGIERARSFSWNESAKGTLRVYEETV